MNRSSVIDDVGHVAVVIDVVTVVVFHCGVIGRVQYLIDRLSLGCMARCTRSTRPTRVRSAIISG